jgi:hypothetical protein
MIDDVERLMESALVDLATGMHNPEVQEPPPLTPSSLEEVLLKEPILFDENGDNGRRGLVRGVVWGNKNVKYYIVYTSSMYRRHCGLLHWGVRL